jgi:hypothetical protein
MSGPKQLKRKTPRMEKRPSDDGDDFIDPSLV